MSETTVKCPSCKHDEFLPRVTNLAGYPRDGSITPVYCASCGLGFSIRGPVKWAKKQELAKDENPV